MSEIPGDVEAAADLRGPGDPLASIRPELPLSPPRVAATVELLDSEEREPTLDSSQFFQQSGHFLVPVIEPDAEPTPGLDASYELLAKIGAGGMGEVWEARQRALGRRVALKRLRVDKRVRSSVISQFESEARLTAVLDHPNIAPVHELGHDQLGRVFYTMKLINGTAWSESLPSAKRRTSAGERVNFELRDHLEILLEVSQAIAFAHSHGVIHRDIKPGNVMIGAYGEVLVVDWGLAVALRPLSILDGAATWTLANLPRSALVCGTPVYMSPETATASRDQLGLATDVYLLGAVLFHVLYGHPPHRGKSVDDVMAEARVNGWTYPTTIAAKNEAWNNLLRPIIDRALGSDPSSRFPDAGAFKTALREALRNYDSARLSSRAARTLKDLADYATATDVSYGSVGAVITQLRAALESWPGNLGARRTLAQAHLVLARLALASEDLALAETSIAAFETLPLLSAGSPQTVGAADSDRSMGTDVQILRITDDSFVDDQAELADRARDLREGIREVERATHKRRVALRVLASVAALMVVVVLVLVALTGVALQRARDQARSERNQLSRVLLNEAANTAAAELGVLFKPVHSALLTSVLWAQTGALDVDDPELLNAYFMPLLEGVDTATSMLRADAGGYEYMLLRHGQGWQTRTTLPDPPQRRDQWSRAGDHMRTWTEDRGYDPHTRPWYQGGAALRAQARAARLDDTRHPVHWTAPYRFYTTNEFGISVSAPAVSISGREFVIAFDVKLDDISTFSSELPAGIDQGQVFVLDEQLRVIGLPKETKHLSDEEQDALMLASLEQQDGAPVSRAAFMDWRRRGQTTEPFRMELGREEVYWVKFRRVDLYDRPTMWIGVVVRESHFLADD